MLPVITQGQCQCDWVCWGGLALQGHPAKAGQGEWASHLQGMPQNYVYLNGSNQTVLAFLGKKEGAVRKGFDNFSALETLYNQNFCFVYAEGIL